MTKGRVEAFSDGVIAIIITIMVLELKAPEGTSFEAIRPALEVFLSYVLSFVFVGIYWANHHHMLHLVKHVSGAVLWANMHLLFWLSMVPFVTRWFGEAHDKAVPCAAFGIVAFLCGVAWLILQATITRINGGRQGDLARAVGSDWKGKVSAVMYVTGIALTFASWHAAVAVYAATSVMWLIPDRRFERAAREHAHD